MPLFDYECQDCCEVTELLIGHQEQVEPVCEHCGSKHVERMLALFGIEAKGHSGSRASAGGAPAAERPCGRFT